MTSLFKIPNAFLVFPYIPFVFDDQSFEKGLQKIAVEFALHNNVKIDDLNLAFANNCFCDNPLIFPYVDNSECSLLFERMKSRNNKFLSHSLILFSSAGEFSNSLYVFIELFGTFQFYVCLGTNLKSYYETKSFFSIYVN